MLTLLVTIGFVHLIAAATPGPDFFFVTRTAVSQSRAQALAGVAGITAGVAVWATLSLLGLQLLFEAFPWVERIVTIAGGCYLIYLGALLLRGAIARRRAGRSPEHEPEPEVSAEDTRTPFRRGLFTNLSNAKVIIYFSSIFSSYAALEMDVAARAAVLGVVILVTFLWFACVALVFGTPVLKRAYRRASIAIDAFAGVIFGSFGVMLLAPALRTLLA